MITSLDLIVKDANVKNLPTEEQISQGYKHVKSIMAKGDDNPKRFAWEFIIYRDYLIEAATNWHNQVLVDLGCGRQLDGYMVAKLAGARAYVAVDPYNLNEFYQKLTNDEEKNGNEELNERVLKTRKFIQNKGYNKNIVERVIQNIDSHLNGKHLPVALVAEDMVSALRRLPKDSVSVMTAGLDKCIIWEDEYAELAEKEIDRVLHPSGAYLAICSRLVPKKLIKDPSFEGNGFMKFTKL